MRAPIFRLSEPDAPMVEILRTGNYPTHGLELTGADLDAMAENFAEVPVDYDHSFSEGRGSKAAGWIREVARSGKSLYAKIDWTPHARDGIEHGEWRFFSAELVKDAAAGARLLAGALTNRPAIKGMKPVTLSEPKPEAVGWALSDRAAAVTTTEPRAMLARLAEDTEALHEAVTALTEAEPRLNYADALGEVLALSREARELERWHERSDVNADSLVLHERALRLQQERGIPYEEAASIIFSDHYTPEDQ